MNYHQEQLQWNEVSVCLPVPMWVIKPTLSGDYITIVGYSNNRGHFTTCYVITAEEVISSLNQSPSTTAVSTQWKEMSSALYYYTTTVPLSNPPMIIGGTGADPGGWIGWLATHIDNVNNVQITKYYTQP